MLYNKLTQKDAFYNLSSAHLKETLQSNLQVLQIFLILCLRGLSLYVKFLMHILASKEMKLLKAAI